jgi:thioredoxin 1
MSEHISEATDANWDETVIKSDVPVLVDFWAPWCGPCRAVSPILEEIAKDYQGKLKIVKLNIDDNQQVDGSLGIRSIPTLILFSGGQERERVIGLRPKGDLTNSINKALGG